MHLALCSSTDSVGTLSIRGPKVRSRFWQRARGRKRMQNLASADVPARTGGVYWPRDLLAHDLKEARIISWGYDADVAQPFHHSSQASIFDHSENLLTDLRDLRVDTVAAARPIIFVCHSLGGLVVKEVCIFFLSDASSHW